MKRWLILLLALAVAGLIGGAGYLGFRGSQPAPVAAVVAPPTAPVTVCDVEQTIAAPGNLINTREQTLPMPVAGRLAEILVLPGDVVEAGQVLARLADSEQFSAAVADAQLDVLQAQKAAEDLYAGYPLKSAQAQLAVTEAQKALEEAQKARNQLDYPRASAAMIAEAEARLALANDQLAEAEKIYDNLTELPADNPQRAAAMLALSNAQREQWNAIAALNWYKGNPSDTEIALADASLALAGQQWLAAREAYSQTLAGPDALDIALAEASVDDAQARLDAAEQDLNSLVIAAPFAGVVLDVQAKAGETLPEGSPLLTLNDPQSVEIEATILEEDYPYVEIGQPAALYFDALPDEEIRGEIARILPKRAAGDRPLYYVYIRLDRVPQHLVAGMSADAAVVIARRAGVLCLPRALAQAANNNKAVVEVWANGQKQKRTVEVGLRGDSAVEILSGLEEGELVVGK